jgi:3-oxoacyl-[acyl-carrier protein] reductase
MADDHLANAHPTLPLKGQTALVTGSSRGIGAEIARALARQGARVAVHYNSEREGAQALVAQIRDSGGEAVALQADLSETQAPKELVRRAAEALQGLDILVNNAAVFPTGPLETITEDQIDRTLAVNVRAMMVTSREFAALPRPEGRRGRIVNVSSIAGSVPSGGSALYSASKAAINSFTRSIAMELGPRLINVNAVAPGLTETDMTKNFTDVKRQAIGRGTALGRLGRPEEIAAVVPFLCTDAANWITGQVIGADGGMATGAFSLMKAAGVL